MRKLFCLFAMASVLLSCGSRINGTKIAEGNNLVGVITDAETGKGIEGVAVTDGYTFTLTDKNGVYQMVADTSALSIYYTTPAEYEIFQNDSTGIPEFFSTTPLDLSKVNRNDFSLKKLPAVEENFTLLMIGDPQVKRESHVDRYAAETVKDIQATVNAGLAAGTMSNVYAITLGDIIFDSVDLWPLMKESMSNVELSNGGRLAFFNCIGNHDHSALYPTDVTATIPYVNTFGPVDYSFDRGNVHVVVMDNVICTKHKVEHESVPDDCQWAYYGGLTDRQIEWLRQDLANVKDKENKMVVFCAHIPFRGASDGVDNHDNLLALLTDFHEAHLMIGHTHYSQNYIHEGYVCKGGLPVYEHIHSGACGSWWASDSDVVGAPNGYNVYAVEGNHIAEWYNKGTGCDADFQLRVYDGNQSYTGSKGYKFSWHKGGVGGTKKIEGKGNPVFKNCFVAQVWDDDNTYWKVEMYQDGKKIGDFVRLENGPSMNAAYSAYAFNELGKNSKTWVLSGVKHLWYFKPASGKPAKEKNWEVRATRTYPGSDITKVYTCSTLTTDFTSF